MGRSDRPIGRGVFAAAVVGLLGLTAVPLPAAEPVSLESLLTDVLNRGRLAQVPSPAYVCRQFSSYDRDTVGVGKPGWFANWDRSQFVRTEENAGRREYVMLDAEGPGAVVRFWGTWHGPRKDGRLEPFSNGTLRVYLDNRPEPAIEGPVADLISGGKLIGPPLSESVSPETPYERRGHNLYLPIPYQDHCKITYESDKIIDFGGQRGEALYYQINYRTYEPQTTVVSFRKEQLNELEPLLEKVGRRLVESGLADTPPLSTADLDLELPPSEEPCSLLRAEGAGAVYQLTVRLEAKDVEQALRSVVLIVNSDGARTVWCPVGDFFGVGHKIRAYRSWYTEVTDDGTMRCFWVMPHQKSCQVCLVNLGSEPVRVQATAHVGDYEWDDRSMHFCASWRQYTKIDTGPNKDQTGNGAFDVNYVEIEGQGKIVGDTLTVYNGISAWWGEGDEKIFIDGEEFPSHVGTGTEDYYGYAWCRPEKFQSPFHAQPCGDGNLAGGFSVNSRYRILDALPFTKSIKLDMELWHWRNTRMNFAPTTFWYARPGAASNVKPDPKTAALPVPKKRGDVVEVLHVPGAIEGETLKVVEKTGGTTEIQDASTFRWSGDRQLWWRDGKPGDRLVLEVPVDKAGQYRVTANLTKAVDYGVVKMTLNGQAAGEALDRHAAAVSHDAIDLGRLQLKQGPNRLEVEIVGANEKAVKRYMFGLDYLKLDQSE
ncbi:MAG: glycoside hydrolase family 172 protein [Planctomycetota bacterium]